MDADPGEPGRLFCPRTSLSLLFPISYPQTSGDLFSYLRHGRTGVTEPSPVRRASSRRSGNRCGANQPRLLTHKHTAAVNTHSMITLIYASEVSNSA